MSQIERQEASKKAKVPMTFPLLPSYPMASIPGSNFFQIPAEDESTAKEQSTETVGSRIEIKHLYGQFAKEPPHALSWVEELPEEVIEQQAGKELEAQRHKDHQTYALIQRHLVIGGDMDTQSIEINSSYMRRVLKDVFAGYIGLDMNAPDLIFMPPLAPFVHRWDRLLQTQREEIDPECRLHVDFLVSILEVELAERLRRFRQINETGYCEFKYLYLAFVPGEIVVSRRPDGTFCAGLLRQFSCNAPGLGSDQWQCLVDTVEWNGETFGYRQVSFAVSHYTGSQLVGSLRVFPLRLHQEAEHLKQSLLKRGKIYESLKGQHFKALRPASTGKHPEEDLADEFEPSHRQQKTVEERIMADTYAFYSVSSRMPKPLLTPLSRPQENILYSNLQAPVLHPPPPPPAGPHDHLGIPPPPQPAFNPFSPAPIPGAMPGVRPGYMQPAPMPPPPMPVPFEVVQAASRPKHSKKTKKRKTGIPDPTFDGLPESDPVTELTDEQCILAAPEVRGYSLQEGRWNVYRVEDLGEISWNDGAFDKLVLSDDYKLLINALVGQDSNAEPDDFDDFIRGKGVGICLLLCGPTGTGKTLTAEAIAEQKRQPLYRLGAGDIGSDTISVESTLKSALDLCAHWNAILLIDEADVFLQKRSTDALRRNEMVSIFLRELEFYTGTMILTTNRVRGIDAAFESRIDLTLIYEDLTPAARAQIWRNFLAMLPPAATPITPEEIEQLAKRDFNGRQIKSAIKTARILARKEKESLSMRHLDIVLNLRERTRDVLEDPEAGFLAGARGRRGSESWESVLSEA